MCTASSIGAPSRLRVTRLMPIPRSEEHTSELQSRSDLVCRLLLEKKKIKFLDEAGGTTGVDWAWWGHLRRLLMCIQLVGRVSSTIVLCTVSRTSYHILQCVPVDD